MGTRTVTRRVTVGDKKKKQENGRKIRRKERRETQR